MAELNETSRAHLVSILTICIYELEAGTTVTSATSKQAWFRTRVVDHAYECLPTGQSCASRTPAVWHDGIRHENRASESLDVTNS